MLIKEQKLQGKLCLTALRRAGKMSGKNTFGNKKNPSCYKGEIQLKTTMPGNH